MAPQDAAAAIQRADRVLDVDVVNPVGEPPQERPPGLLQREVHRVHDRRRYAALAQDRPRRLSDSKLREQRLQVVEVRLRERLHGRGQGLLVVGGEVEGLVRGGVVDLDAPVKDNLKNIARRLGRDVDAGQLWGAARDHALLHLSGYALPMGELRKLLDEVDGSVEVSARPALPITCSTSGNTSAT